MKIIRTHEMSPDDLSPWEQYQVYNGLDCCVTLDVFDGLYPQLDNMTRNTYEFSKSLQGPLLEMSLRGILVDQSRRLQVLDEYLEKIDQIERQLDQIVLDGVGMPTFNWRSSSDLRKLFYDYLELPPIRKAGRPTTDRAAREKLAIYRVAQQLVAHINILADLGKKVSVLRTGIDSDGRIRTSYNIAGTSTGRLSSSFTEFGTGGNLQNIEESLRSILVSDPGYKFAKFDTKSGESYCVGAIEWNLFGDGTYLDAIESGDIHTFVAKLCWPHLAWTGDIKADKTIAEQKFYRHLSYRDMAKKLGHGSSYGGRPATLSEQSRIPILFVKEFQPKFFAAFPAHQKWQAYVDQTLRKKGYLISLMGRKRWFFGRRNDPDTLREAIAYDPQSSLAEIVNQSLLKLWRMNICPIVMHDHDALTFMYKQKDEDKIIPVIQEHLVVPVELANGRIMRIPSDCQVGWNKGKYHEQKNPNGLKDYYGTDTRKRQKEAGILDRLIHRTNK